MFQVSFVTGEQVQLYVPEEAHPAFGVMRAIVKDASDLDLGATSQARCCGLAQKESKASSPPLGIRLHVRAKQLCEGPLCTAANEPACMPATKCGVGCL